MLSYNNLKKINLFNKENKVSSWRVSPYGVSLSVYSEFCCITRGSSVERIKIQKLIQAVEQNKIHIQNISILRNWINSRDGQDSPVDSVSVYTGNTLKTLVDNDLNDITAERDFVSSIYKYVTSNRNEVMGVHGLRGVGKSIGLMQVIRLLNDFDNTVYLVVNPEQSLDYSDFYKLLFSVAKYRKYIFIDEITYVSNFINKSANLYEALVLMGKRVVICGTNSLALVSSKSAALYHRIGILPVSFMSYFEAKRTAHISNFIEYLEMGGLYDKDRLGSFSDLENYIDTSVVDNIVGTLSKNMVTSHLAALYNLSITSKNIGLVKQRMKTIIFKILFDIIFSLSKSDIKIDMNILPYLFNSYSSSSDIYDTIGIENSSIGVYETRVVLKALYEIGLLNKVENIAKCGEFKYYITNQSVYNQMLCQIVNIPFRDGYSLNEFRGVKSRLGLLMESAVINHTYEIVRKMKDISIYYYRDGNKEIDLIIRRHVYDLDDLDNYDKYLYYEIKISSDTAYASIKAQWITDKSIGSPEKVVGRAVIYNGITTVYDGVTKPKKSIPNISAEKQTQIMQRNKGLQFINVEDYLRNLPSYIDDLMNIKF